jgi:uncharacterized membrane protein YphA (DoxX/SURF4 family)
MPSIDSLRRARAQALSIPFPEANAFVVSRLEFWGGLLLIAGLLTWLERRKSPPPA